jgi:hypothetical protein
LDSGDTMLRSAEARTLTQMRTNACCKHSITYRWSRERRRDGVRGVQHVCAICGWRYNTTSSRSARIPARSICGRECEKRRERSERRRLRMLQMWRETTAYPDQTTVPQPNQRCRRPLLLLGPKVSQLGLSVQRVREPTLGNAHVEAQGSLSGGVAALNHTWPTGAARFGSSGSCKKRKKTYDG